MQLLLVSQFNVFKQLPGVQFHIIVVSVLYLYLLLEVDCQFHYFLLARAADLLHTNTLLVMCWTHVVQFLLQLAILHLVLLFLSSGLLVDSNWLFIGEVNRESFPVKFGAGFRGCLTLQFEGFEEFFLRLNHDLFVSSIK